jgi:hypothetical protein
MPMICTMVVKDNLFIGGEMNGGNHMQGSSFFFTLNLISHCKAARRRNQRVQQ